MNKNQLLLLGPVFLLFFINGFAQEVEFFNADGFFSIGTMKDDTYNIETGDINGDGFPDIIESNSGTWNLYYRTLVK